MDDLISRQAAIDAHYEYCNKHPDAGFPVWSLKILEDLPPAQADSKELSGTHKALDTVSRQAVIEAINKIFPADPMRDDYTQGITCGAALANIYVAQLPSAQPETHEERTETHGVCLDTISRQEAIAATRNAKISFTIKSDIDFANYRKEIQEMFNNILDAQEKALKELPSAQPEHPKGQWTYICNSDVNGLKIVECSKCHKRAYGSGNYCHNCGAEMVKGWE